MSQPAGWYDDPQDASMLRYWDGVQWTHHTSPRQRPAPPQAAPGSQQQGYGYSGQQQGYGYPGQQQDYGYPGQQQQQNPYAGQTGQYPYQGGMYAPAGGRATTPDGQELAGWWLRLLARIIDGLLIGVVVGSIGLFIIFSDLRQRIENWIDDIVRAVDSGGSEMPELPTDILIDLGYLSAIIAVSALIYETVLTSLFGGTLGKLMVGIRVRLRDEPGNPGWGPSAVRALVWNGPGLLSLVPVIGNLTGIFNLLNGLWPLWDDKKQSISDKVAKTNVVRR